MELTADPANLAFHKAGFDFYWKKTSPKRQMKILQDNKGCDCVVGWFKKPKREAFAKYSHVIYRDKPQIALARADNDKLQNDMTLDDLLSQPADAVKEAVIMDVQRHIAGHEVYGDITLVVIKQL